MSRDNWSSTRDWIAISTSGLATGALRVNAKRLNDDETADLIRLSLRQRDGETLNNRELERWEKLAEAAAGRQQGSVFEQARDTARLVRELAELNRGRNRPPRRVALEEPGSVTLSREICFDLVAKGVLWPAHIAALAYLMAAFENGGLPIDAPGVSFENGEIVFSGQRSGLLPDPGGSFVHEKDLLDHLDKLGFIAITRQGRSMRIKPGGRLRNSMKRAA